MTVTSRSSCISDSTVIVDVIVLRTLKLEISTYCECMHIFVL